MSAYGSRVELDFHYRFEPRLALAQAPYAALSDLVALPGRLPGTPLVSRERRSTKSKR